MPLRKHEQLQAIMSTTQYLSVLNDALQLVKNFLGYEALLSDHSIVLVI